MVHVCRPRDFRGGGTDPNLRSAQGQIAGEPTNRQIESQIFKLADYMNCPAWLVGRAGSLDVTLLAVFLPPFPPVHTS